MRTSVFLSHSSKGAFARQVRDGLYAALNKRFDVLLDQKRLEPGDQWRAKLHVWLATCHAAVILFSRDAVGTKTTPGSEWVRKEATILTWRQALDPRLLIVPVLLGDVTPEETRSHGLQPLAVDELQFVRAPSTKETPANAKLLIKAVVARLGKLAAPPVDPELQDWLRRVAVCLKKVDPSDLKAAANAMRIPRVDLAGAADQQYATLGYHMLFSDRPVVEAALPYLANSMPADQLQTFARLVLPALVPPEAARAIVPAARLKDDPHRFVAINTEYQAVAEQYVHRATCCAPGVALVRATGVRGETPALALNAFDNAFRRQLNIPLDRPAEYVQAQCLQQREPWFALVGQGALARDVLAELRVRYPKVTFVLVPGLTFPDPQKLGLARLYQVDPPLDKALQMATDLAIGRVLGALGLKHPDAGEVA